MTKVSSAARERLGCERFRRAGVHSVQGHVRLLGAAFAHRAQEGRSWRGAAPVEVAALAALSAGHALFSARGVPPG
ncbi:MAG: hypothetical protein H6725_05520 [Sandaracinaceae bacterium]|nr:hypothetical protein [Sandaracinaceae bacterium]